MIESLRKALADYEYYLDFIDEGHRIVVVVKHKLAREDFAIINAQILELGGLYQPWKEGGKAHWTIPKRKPVQKSESSGIRRVSTKSLKPGVMLPKLPDDTRINVSYSRKVCPRQYESIGYSASVDVPYEFKDSAYLVVTDCVEGQVAKRLKELEQQ